MAEEKRKDPIVKGSVKVKSESAAGKLAKLFLTSDFQSVKRWIIEDKLVPGAKNLLLDSLAMILTGDSRYHSSSGRTDYSRSSVSSVDNRNDVKRQMSRGRSNYRDLIFETRDDAERVVAEMIDTVEKYDRVSILDLYDYANMASQSNPNDDYYGWRRLPLNARDYVVAGSKGYELRLPAEVVL